ncbi:MAG: hypothetical protein RIF33_12735 [Cyclobacteriaceae bacterium]
MTREEVLDCFKVVIDMHPDIVLKGKTMPYTSANGHMFSSLNKAGELGLRLDKEDREQFLVDHQTELFVTYNTVMKEYVHVPESLLQQPKKFLTYLEKSYQYILSLKPK